MTLMMIPKMLRPVVIMFLAVLATGIAASDERPTWNAGAAAKYLDDRMDAWFANAKKLRTGDTQTACVSCHTTLPYALARPALRQAMRVTSATPQEVKMLEEVARRVETYGAHQLQYETNDSKKTESRGTEAVLNALILVNADERQDRRTASAVTEKALARMWETERADGAWDWLDFGLEPFETIDGAYYGATLAALTAGTASSVSAERSTTRARKVRAYLKGQFASQRLFNRTWVLLASTRMSDLLTPEERAALVAELQARQGADGGWSLAALGTWRWNKTAEPFRAPGTTDASLLAQPDGYATGLVVYTLMKAGCAANDAAVSKGLAWLRRHQTTTQIGEQTWTAWRAHSLNFDREHGGDKGEPWRRMFMSDTATGFAVLALTAADLDASQRRVSARSSSSSR